MRPVEPTDVAVFFEHHRDPEARRMAAFVSVGADDREAFDARWARLRSDPTVVARTVLLGDRVVGHVAKFVRDGHAEVTYWIDRAVWGRGVATRALRALLRDVTERPVRAGAAADNAASRRVLGRCGFRHIGVERAFAPARGESVDEDRFELR